MAKRAKSLARGKKPKPRKKVQVHQQSRVRTEQVASPWNNGFDKVERVIDTIGALHKRKQIDEQEHQAAVRFRWAFEQCHGGIKSALNDDKFATSEPSWKTPSDRMIKAAEIIKEARNLLGATDYVILQMVAGQGLTIEQTTGHLYGHTSTGKPSGDDMRLVGARLRGSLASLAIRWFGTSRSPKPRRAYVTSGALPMIIATGGIIELGKVAHAGIDQRGRFTVTEGSSHPGPAKRQGRGAAKQGGGTAR